VVFWYSHQTLAGCFLCFRWSLFYCLSFRPKRNGNNASIERFCVRLAATQILNHGNAQLRKFTDLLTGSHHRCDPKASPWPITKYLWFGFAINNHRRQSHRLSRTQSLWIRRYFQHYNRVKNLPLLVKMAHQPEMRVRNITPYSSHFCKARSDFSLCFTLDIIRARSFTSGAAWLFGPTLADETRQ